MEQKRTIRNKVVSYCISELITLDEFKGKVISAGISFDTADRMIQGETNFNLKTLDKLCRYLNCQITDLFRMEPSS